MTPRVSQQACARDALGPSNLEIPQHTRSPGTDMQGSKEVCGGKEEGS